MRYQNLIVSWKEGFESGMKPSSKYRVNKVPWRLQIERGTMHWGRWYEGPNGTDYRPGNTHDRLADVRAPFTAEEWQERKNYRSYDLMKLGYALLGIFLLYRFTGEWPVVWCDEACCGSKPGFKVCVVGGAGGIGQPLSLLMATCPLVK